MAGNKLENGDVKETLEDEPESDPKGQPLDPNVLSTFNDFMTDQHRSKVKDDMNKLEIKNAGAAFFKKLELLLNVTLFDIRKDLTKEETAVRLNPKVLNSSKAKQDGLQVVLPVPTELCLPLVSQVSTAPSKGSISCANVLGVSQLDLALVLIPWFQWVNILIESTGT